MKQVLAVLPLCLAASLVSTQAARAQSDVAPPQVTVDTPRTGVTYTQAQLSGALISGRARDNLSGSGIAQVAVLLSREANGATRFYDGRGFNAIAGKYLLASFGGTGDLKAWSFRLPTISAGLLPGVYRVRALARDHSGNSGYSALASFAVRSVAPTSLGDQIGPSLSFVAPTAGATYSSTETRFGAIGNVADNAGGGGVASVHIVAYRYADASGPAGYFNGQTFSSPTPIENPTRVPPTTGSQPTQWLFDPFPFVYTPGRILLRVVARDRAGNISQATLVYTRR